MSFRLIAAALPALSSLLTALLLWAALLPNALARDAISGRSAWQEPCGPGAAGPARVAQLPLTQFRPFDGPLALGYGACPVWLRLRIDPAAGTLVLRILPSFLDQVELFDPLQPDAAATPTGDRHPPGDALYRSLALQLALPGDMAPRDVFLRLQTTSTRLISLQALPLREAIEKDRRHELLCIAYLALLGVTLLVAIAHWQRGRDPLIGMFVFKQTLAVVWALLLLGFGRLLGGESIPASLIDGLTSLVVLGFTTASMAFDRLLTLEYRPPRWGPAVLLVCMALLPVELLLMASGATWLALAINATAATLCMAVTLAAILLARPPVGADAPVPSRRQLALFYGVIVVPVCVAMLAQLGLLPELAWGLYGTLLHGLLSGVFMLGMLAARARRQRRQQAEAEAELARTQAMVQQERLHRDDREKLLNMLTHELKTPLAVMRMLLGPGLPSAGQVAQIQRSLADIDDVVERCSQAGQLDDRRLRAQVQPCNVRAELDALTGDACATRAAVLEVDASAWNRGQGAGTVQTDPQLLRIILGNLIDNACKYRAPGTPVTIRLSHGQEDGQEYGLQDGREGGRDQVLIDISNLPGPAGWPDPQRLFDKYYRGPGAHRQTGSGLGLYLTAGLVQLLGARLHYRPTATHVSFRLCLPR